MRAGELNFRVKFYAKTVTTDEFGSSAETFTYSFSAWAEEIYVRGDLIISNDEKFWSGVKFLKVRYRADILENMQVDHEGQRFRITYIEEYGKKEGLKLTIQKIND